LAEEPVTILDQHAGNTLPVVVVVSKFSANVVTATHAVVKVTGPAHALRSEVEQSVLTQTKYCVAGAKPETVAGDVAVLTELAAVKTVVAVGAVLTVL